MTDAEEASQATASRTALPYLSFETFRKFVDELGDGRPVPPRIDRSLMMGMAGGTQTLLLGALSLFDLVGASRAVTPAFVRILRMGETERKSAYAQLLAVHYAPMITLSAQQGTADQLAEVFRQTTGYQGSTMRKAVTFFLNMAKYAELELSPYFRPPPQTAAAVRRVRRAKPPNSESPLTVTSAPPPGESKTVQLISGGIVTVSCSATFLELSRDDRAFVFELVDRLLDYETAQAVHGKGTESNDGHP